MPPPRTGRRGAGQSPIDICPTVGVGNGSPMQPVRMEVGVEQRQGMET